MSEAPRTRAPSLTLRVCVAIGAALATIGFAQAQQPATPPAAQQPPAAEKPRELLAIVGGDVYTITHEIVRNGTVLVRDGKIWKVGQDLVIPEGAKMIDAKGKVVTPGFIAVQAMQIGVGPAAGAGRVQDALDPYDRNMEFALGSGITTACVTSGAFFTGFQPPPDPSGGGPGVITTRHAVIKFTFGDLDGMYVKDNPFYWIRSSMVSGQVNRFNWRDNLSKAKRFVADSAQYDRDKAANKPNLKQPTRPGSEDYVKLVKGEHLVRLDASTTDQIRDMLDLAREYGYRVVIDGAHEAWRMADEISAAKATVILTPRAQSGSRRRGREDATGSSIETAAFLEKAGVAFATNVQQPFVSLDGIAGRDLTSLAIEAAFGVRGGCSEKAALESITIVPAQMLGIADRVGSIEPGKDADLLILDGPPLDYRSYAETVIINGKVYYERAKNRVYPVYERQR